MEIAVLVGLVFINAFFAMSEISLVTASKARLQKLIDAGDRSAQVAATLGAEPTRFLSTIQIGITSVGLLSGIVGEATLAPPLAASLTGVGVPAHFAGYLATGLVVAVVTYFSIVIGELLPKRVGQMFPEAIARLVARPIHLLAVGSKPFVHLLSASTYGLLRLLRVDERRRSAVTEEEIHAVLAEGSEAGVIEADEHRMVRNLFRLDDLAVVSFMTPRADMVTLSSSANPDDILKVLETLPHSRYPVVGGDEEDIVGVVSARELLLRSLHGQPLDLQTIAEPPVFVPETVSGMELLDRFRRTGDHLALAVDEYGTVRGLITLHDLLEAITGSIKTAPGAEEEWALRREDGSWLFDGQISIHELLDHLGVREPAAAMPYKTLSGLIIHKLARLSRTGDRVTLGRWTLEVVDMDGYRIDKVLATPAD